MYIAPPLLPATILLKLVYVITICMKSINPASTNIAPPKLLSDYTVVRVSSNVAFTTFRKD